MDQTQQFTTIFQKGSKTFYNSSLFFPKDVREKITRLYAFVRVVDDFVDSIPQQKIEFYDFWKTYEESFSQNVTSGDAIIDSFVALEKEEGLNHDWVQSFFKSMEMDLTKHTYKNLEETKAYIYGSANVIGLCMAKVLKLPAESYQAAEYLGMAFQYINFIRDINEDIDLQRLYFPQDILVKYSLTSLTESETIKKPEQFKTFVRETIDQYYQWQKHAEKGFRYIPKRYRIAIKTASDMYAWTASQIAKDPYVVYRKKVKPSKSYIVFQALKNLIIG